MWIYGLREIASGTKREAAETKSGSGSLNGISVGGFLRKERGSFVFHVAPIHLHNSPTGGGLRALKHKRSRGQEVWTGRVHQSILVAPEFSSER